ncbi:MAG: hypothetical protein Q8O67_06190 [Deltaproteobacteria bacterium]|nr:hypothetical protein [Deltaproteobacteria bacterium]
MRTSRAIPLMLVCAACVPTFPRGEQVPHAVADDFADPAIKARYHHQGGSWRVVDGALTTLGDHNLPLWLEAPLSKNVRIEFTSTSASPEVDMKVEVFGDGIRHESGYIVIVGGWKNTVTAIARLDEHEKGRASRRTRWEQGKTCRWTIQRTDGRTLELFLDGERQLRYEDPDPLYGERNNRFAFSGWESEVTFDDLVITPLPDT